jgi:Transposase DDE domain group 1
VAVPRVPGTFAAPSFSHLFWWWFGRKCELSRTGADRLLGLPRQAIYGRLAGYEDVNDAERLACDPAMRAIIGREGLDRLVASSSQMGRFEAAWLATDANLETLPICRVLGSIGSMTASRFMGSSSTWTAPRARPTASKKVQPGMATSAAPVITRSLCSERFVDSRQASRRYPR